MPHGNSSFVKDPDAGPHRRDPWVGLEKRHLVPQAVVERNVIGVLPSHVLTVAPVKSESEGLSHAKIVGEAVESNRTALVLLFPLERPVATPVIHDHYLEIHASLPTDRFQGSRKVPHRVMNGEEDADGRHEIPHRFLRSLSPSTISREWYFVRQDFEQNLCHGRFLLNRPPHCPQLFIFSANEVSRR